MIQIHEAMIPIHEAMIPNLTHSLSLSLSLFSLSLSLSLSLSIQFLCVFLIRTCLFFWKVAEIEHAYKVGPYQL